MSKDVLLSRVAVESFTVAPDEAILKKKALQVAVLDPGSTLLLVNGSEAGLSSYEFIPDESGKAGMVLSMKSGWNSGDKVLLIYRRKMFDLYGELMTRAVSEGSSRSNAKSFAEITQQQHEWVSDIFATVFEEIDNKLALVDQKLLEFKQKFNEHQHTDGAPTVLIE